MQQWSTSSHVSSAALGLPQVIQHAHINPVFVLYMIRREMQHFVQMRHEFLLSKSHTRLAQARTVLITSIPGDLATEHDLRTFASFVPGGVDRVWLFRDTRELNELFEERQDTCNKLEQAEAELLKTAVKVWRRKEGIRRKAQKHKSVDEEKNDQQNHVPPASRALLDELVPLASRPRHRTGFLGIIGPKVDTVDWCKVCRHLFRWLQELIPHLEE